MDKFTLKPGETVRAIYPNSRLGTATVTRVSIENPKLKPITVRFPDGTQGHFHPEQVIPQSAEITLDGTPAKICGYQNRFGTVATADREITFSWPTIARVAWNGGKFKS